ncbi:hypothetical protein IW262DRAFT_1468045 [Armillaria fumosa]|nr:hypothetical protein IW262DRAFT_1468045 [Armillaria fumosa]
MTALLKHRIFNNIVHCPESSEEERCIAYVSVEAKLNKKFHNHKYQKVTKNSMASRQSSSHRQPDHNDSGSKAVSNPKDLKLLVQLLKFSGTISAQKIFDDHHRESIQARAKELLETGQVMARNSGGADRHALKQLWEEAGEEEQEQCEQMALEAIQDQLNHFLGPATFMFTFACCNAQGMIDSGCINVSWDDSHKIQDSLAPNFLNQVSEWANINLPVHAHKDVPCPPTLSFVNLQTHPEDYYDVEKWSGLPLMTAAPKDMDPIEALVLAKFLQEHSNNSAREPFCFYDAVAPSLPSAPAKAICNQGTCTLSPPASPLQSPSSPLLPPPLPTHEDPSPTNSPAPAPQGVANPMSPSHGAQTAQNQLLPANQELITDAGSQEMAEALTMKATSAKENLPATVWTARGKQSKWGKVAKEPASDHVVDPVSINQEVHHGARQQTQSTWTTAANQIGWSPVKSTGSK